MALGYAFGPEALTEEKDLQFEEDMRLMDATADRAVELFLDNNMSAPLETSCNVESFALRVKTTSKP